MHSQKDDDDRDADDAVLLLVFRPLNSTGQLRQSRRQTTLWRPPLQLQQDCQTRRQQQRRPQSPHQAQIVAAHRPGKCFVFSLFLSLSIICILSTAEKTLVYYCICTHVMSSMRYIYASIERKRENKNFVWQCDDVECFCFIVFSFLTSFFLATVRNRKLREFIERV